MNNKKVLSVFLSGAIALSSNIAMADNSIKWYTDSVNYGKQQGIVAEDVNVLNGINSNYILNSLYRIENSTGGSLEEVTKWALDNKIVSKDFDLTKKLNRSELTSIIINYTKFLNLELDNSIDKIKEVKDFNDISEEYVDSITAAYNLGLINGKDNGYLKPLDMTNQAEFLTILLNLSKLNIENNSIDTAEESIKGTVVGISKYGNVTTSITIDDFKSFGFEPGDLIKVKVNQHEMIVPFGDTYSNVDNQKEIIVPDNDEGKIAIAINMGNFSSTYSATDGVEMTFSMEEKAGYKEEYEIRSIDKYRTLNREDYSSDEVFANFRPIKMGKIADGILYRTSSPINPKLNRAHFADKLIEKHGVITVMNLADSKEELEEYFTAETFNSPYYKSLYDNGKIIYLDMGVDFTSEDFHNKLKDGLIFLGEQEGPFAIHCNEGKDRAGFAAIVLESLMGASVDEIREDYMKSYINFFFVEKDSKQYDKIAESNVMKSLKMIANVQTEEELRKINLEEKTEIYLEEVIGLNKDQINKLKEVLSKETTKEIAA